MPSAVETYFNAAAAGFSEGRMQPFLLRTVTPFALHIEDDFVSFQSQDAMARALLRYHTLLVGLGVSRLVPLVRALELPRRSRFRSWVELFYHRGPLVLPETSTAIFYGRDTRLGPMFEMVQFLSFAHPEIKSLIPAPSWSV